MKPYVLITRPVSPTAIELLTLVCDILPRIALPERRRADNRLIAANAHALLLATPDRIDDIVLHDFPALRVVACTFRLPEHLDVAACTRRGIWVTNVTTRWCHKDAEIDAARNILDVLSGDTPRHALNEVLQSAA